ncbi:MAG: TetR family transcriptional regulator, partial [Thermoguttaceae bacterium]
MTIDPSLLKSDERIILAAIKIFADYPPELASVRMIAKEAKVNYSAITYH